MSLQEDFRRTIAYGESAIKHIKRDKTPAFPKHYELWYTYSAGFNRVLNDAINQILRTRKKLTTEETTKIYNKHLSPQRIGDRLDSLGTELNTHIETLLRALDTSVSSTEGYSETLKATQAELSVAKTKEDVKTLLEHLTSATQSAASASQSLEDRLCAAKGEIAELKENLEAARYETYIDELTTLPNRKRFERALERMIEEHTASSETFCLMMIDIDRFKAFNDTWGHQTGDQVLRLVAVTLKNNIKGQDIAARFGGEEFVLLLPQTSVQEASIVAENLRVAVMEKKLLKRSTGESLGKVTISIGIGEYRSGEAKQALIERADKALYAAKRAGRNQVKMEALEKAPKAEFPQAEVAV